MNWQTKPFDKTRPRGGLGTFSKWGIYSFWRSLESSYSRQFRLLILILTSTLMSCSMAEKNNGLFANLIDQESVEIHLSTYHLDSIPKDIAKLVKVKRLLVTMDSTTGWTTYPPLSTLEQRVELPPFHQLPVEITQLIQLENLGLVGLNLNKLPDNFDKLQNLDSLNLSLNKLSISKEMDKLKKLKNLKYLSIFGNKVDEADIKELKRVIPGIVIGKGLE